MYTQLTESYSGRIPYFTLLSTLLSLRTSRSSLLVFVFTLNIGLTLIYFYLPLSHIPNQFATMADFLTFQTIVLPPRHFSP